MKFSWICYVHMCGGESVLHANAWHTLYLQALVTEFEGWASVEGNKDMAFDWDDALGDAKRRERGLRLEKLRVAEQRRRSKSTRGTGGGADQVMGSKAMAEAMRASRVKKEA